MLSGSIMNDKAVFGLTSGVAFVVATLIGIALSNQPQAADAAALQGALGPCPLAEISLDQGYGVSSKALRPVCARIRQGLASSNAR